MKAKLFFYDTQGNLIEEIIDIPSYPEYLSSEEIEADLANTHLIEFVFDHIDAGVEILEY